MKGFKDFILRGNVVDLAVGVVIGAAFGALVGAFGKAFINPLIAVFVGTPNCPKEATSCLGAHFTVSGQAFSYGDFITAIVVFLITAAIIYFFVVLPVNSLRARFAKEPDPTAPTKDCPECLGVIPEAARRCMFCTVEQPVS